MFMLALADCSRPLSYSHLYREANGEGNPCPFVLAALTTASVSTCADLTAWWEEEGSSSARQGLCTVYGTVQ